MVAHLKNLVVSMSFGMKCVLALLLGIAVALVFPQYCYLWAPAGSMFLRASQLVTMPFIMLELLCSLGELSNTSLRTLVRAGGAALLFIFVAAGAAVLLVPTWLPPIVSSTFFTPSMLDTPAPVNLLEKFIPFNIFGAMAEDNFPAVVLFSCFAGFALQRLPNNGVLLAPLNSARDLFRSLNKIVIRTTPVAVFALVSTTISGSDHSELLRLHALPVIGLLGLLLLSVFVLSITMSVSTLTWTELWRILKAPLILTASTSSLIISLPTLVTTLQEVLAEKFKDRNADVLDTCREQIGAAVPVGFALPTLGQVYMLFITPFIGWYVNHPFTVSEKFRLLATGIPGSLGGIRSAVRQELAEAGLPEHLLNIVFLNTEWIYRSEKTLSLIGLVVLALIVVGATTGTLRLQKRRLIGSLLISSLLALGLTYGVSALLSHTLANSYNRDAVLRARTTLVKPTSSVRHVASLSAVEQATLEAFPALAVTLDSIRERRYVRIGLRSGEYPWAYSNASGSLVGYDIDVLQAAANFSGLEFRMVVAPVEVLESMLERQQIDLAIGGIEENLYRSAKVVATQGYQLVHKALLVHQDRIQLVQSAESHRLGRPLRIAVSETFLPSPVLKDHIEEDLGSPGPPVSVSFTRIPSTSQFLDGASAAQYDALLTTAEGGSSWSVIYPETNVLTVFGRELPNQMVILLGGKDPQWHTFLNQWISVQEAEGLFRRLYKHWILVEN